MVPRCLLYSTDEVQGFSLEGCVVIWGNSARITFQLKALINGEVRVLGQRRDASSLLGTVRSFNEALAIARVEKAKLCINLDPPMGNPSEDYYIYIIRSGE